MKKIILSLVIASVIIATVSLVSANDDTTTLCHKVSVRGGVVYQTIYVTQSYVAIHLAHGDYIGTCPTQ